MHRYVSFVSDQLVFKQFIFKATSILSVSCVLSGCGKSCSTCEIFRSRGCTCKYRLQRLRLLCHSLIEVLQSMSSQYHVIIGDFNVNWMNELERRLLHNLFVTERKYKQLISHYTTDNRTVIDHIYTNIPDLYLTSGILETYFTDHKAIWVSFPFLIN